MAVLNIVLDEDRPADRPYHPGDLVRGKVACALRPGEIVGDAYIIFKGEIITTIIRDQIIPPNGELDNRCDEVIDLFRVDSYLWSSGEAKIYEWPFEFTFPSSAFYHRSTGDALFFEPSYKTAFCNSFEGDLPPSFTFTDYRVDAQCEATVAYTLEVEMNHSRIKQTLIFAPTSPSPYRFPQEPEIADRAMSPCKWASTELRPLQTNSRQKFVDSILIDNFKSLPTIRFQPYITLPVSIAPSVSFPLFVSIDHRRKSDRDPADPTLVLTSLTLTLYSHTTLRVRGAYRDYEHGASQAVASRTYNMLEVNLPLDGTPVPALDSWNVQDLDSGDLVRPGFSSWTVGHKHTLEVAATFEHRETRHEFIAAPKHVPFICLPESRWEGDAGDVHELPVYVGMGAEVGVGTDQGPPEYAKYDIERKPLPLPPVQLEPHAL
ncbi:hypothetical protein K461DRAFT_165514 [Myriangium duriaei CBS 260.36]|uniref:Arrestin-like N-terminal domain-containing protein n=1 Tax=Myriangium duriaei CBS 260.36 TaxID=1168546 RepID=A0A9P4MII0_9PEZI|nr:hypothetical protein K461DRAFT_165514 [Myriangium duriaei CBS 260.36]